MLSESLLVCFFLLLSMQAIKGFVGLSESTEGATATSSDDPMGDACTLTTQQRFVRVSLSCLEPSKRVRDGANVRA